MDQVKTLVDIADTLLGENGCPWDKEQTMQSLQPFLLEELHELLEAIDLEDYNHIAEEAGDLLYGLIFLAKIGEQKEVFTLDDIVKRVAGKMIRRHPHIFGDAKVSSSDDVLKQWDVIKKGEKDKNLRKSALDGIPPTLPLMLKAQKMIKKISKTSFCIEDQVSLDTEEEVWSQKLWLLLKEASQKKIVAEDAFRRFLTNVDGTFRESEKKTTGDDLKA